MFHHKKFLIIPLVFLSLLVGNFASAASCQCAVYSSGKTEVCEKKSEDDCWAQLTADRTCKFFTDDSCHQLKEALESGLGWSASECTAKSVNGVWLPPKADVSVGPYCYEKQDFAKSFELSVDILGINKAGGIKNIGQYVNLLYKLVMGLAIFFAIIMTTVAGFIWLTAGGNTGKIGEAKKKILNALVGLILAAGAYTILQTINPRLLELHLPLIPKIKTIRYAGISDCGDYKNRPDCLANRVGVNQGGRLSSMSARSGTGCGWENGKCDRRAEANPGDNGGRCLADDNCNNPELKCVSTITVVFKSVTKLCTSGNIGASCGEGAKNDGCKKDLKCEPRTKQCYDPTKVRPDSAKCSKDEECADGVCLNKACHTNCTLAECAKKGELCLLKGGEPNATECQNQPLCPGLHGCDEFYVAGTTFCPAELYPDSPTGMKNYLKNTYNVTIPSSGGGRAVSSCYLVNANKSGVACAYDLECVNKKCIIDIQGQAGKCQ